MKENHNYKNVNIRNKKAYFNYEIIEEFVPASCIPATNSSIIS